MIPDSPPRKCFTIGYGDYPIDIFVYFLAKVGIDTIIDVRSYPYSKFNLYFNRDNLENSLRKNNVDYQYLGDKIGGRYSNPNLLFPDGTVNYQKVQETEKFKEGIDSVLSIISSGKKIALMCAEKEPERCHRFVLISRVLQKKGIHVIHIRPEVSLQTNETLEKQLINADINQKQNHLSDEPINEVDSMYERLNRRIAYKVKDFPASEYNKPLPESPAGPISMIEEGNGSAKIQINNNLVSEPCYGPDQVTGMLSDTDKFGTKNQRKEAQQKLF
jgi:hypothetical protein